RTDEILSKRRSIVKRYDKAFSEINGVESIDHFTSLGSSMHLYMVRFTEKDENFRNRFMDRMLEKGVATNVHYKPLPMHTAYKQLGFDIKDYPEAYNMYKNEVSLPLYSLLTDEEVEFIIKTFKETCLELL
ncbi:MAG: DegT/DnrJ/EryC1/StrS family aminotransferase, partial [Clostridia bacterium]|nr:DegT/DnrJ/EryC1/StrS family aminotransferase [Clostridia bacterium]